jgi:hypothetical protein
MTLNCSVTNTPSRTRNDRPTRRADPLAPYPRYAPESRHSRPLSTDARHPHAQFCALDIRVQVPIVKL